MKIAYLGPEGTFTEKVTKKLFPGKQLHPLSNIKRVISAVESGIADFGVVPLENIYNGEVRETLDSLKECSKAKIIQEQAIKIVHSLGALPNHTKIKQIFSKNQALEQCSKYLHENYPESTTIATASTSEAVKRIIEENLKDTAAIASEHALSPKLKILETDICPNNRTRFITLGKVSPRPSGNDKTYIAIHPPLDKPGVLHNILGILSNLEINLEAIQSRPDSNKGYYFYIELAGHEKDPKIKTALDQIKFSLDPKKQNPNTLKILGSYKNTHWKK